MKIRAYFLLILTATLLTSCIEVEVNIVEPEVVPESVEPEAAAEVEEMVETAEVEAEKVVEVAKPWVIPDNATEVLIDNVDFEGDGQDEILISYNSVDDISHVYPDYPLRRNDHLFVYALRDGEYQLIKEDIGANDNVAVETVIRDVQVIDLALDGKEEVFYTKTSGAKSRTYKYTVFGLFEGEIQDFAIPKVYLNNPGQYMTADEEGRGCYAAAGGAGPFEDGLREVYGVTCPIPFAPMSNQPGAERGFSILQKYDGENFETALFETSIW
jgi:hypothetical protein